jgi:hypothetical protein
MNKKVLNILLLSIGITIFGFLADSDPKEPSIVMRFVEFFAVTVLLFTFFAISNYIYNFTKKKVLLSKSK